jgi:16S rRNA processing protein RimM
VEQFIAGFIRGPHGLTGNFRVESSSGEYAHFEAITEVTLRHGDDGEQRVYKVESAEAASGTLYMKVAGINTPEEVKKISGWQIIVPRDKACPLKKDQWYVEDLKNCTLIYAAAENQGKDGLAAQAAPAADSFETVGTITDVLEGGTGDLLEVSLSESCTILADDVKKDSDGKSRTVLVPFSGKFIGAVDMKKRTIQLMHLWILE